MFAISTNVLALIFVLGVMIFVHEFGHYAMAKAFGIGVETFSFGFGKRLFGFRRGETDYRVSLLPLGGYVKMRGENPNEDLSGDPSEYLGRPKWQRLCVLIMGPAMNVLLAFVLFSVVFMVGVEVEANSDQPVTLGWILPESAAAEAGLQPDDRILAVDGRVSPNWQDFRLRIMTSANLRLMLTLERGGQTLELPITPVGVTRSEIGAIGVYAPVPPTIGAVVEGSLAASAGLRAGDLVQGIEGQPIGHYVELLAELRARLDQPTTLAVRRGTETLSIELTPVETDNNAFGMQPIALTKMRRYGPLQATAQALREMRRQASLVAEILGKLLTGRMSIRTLSGPIEIAQFSGGAARSGDPSLLLSFMAVISLQLGLLNLLPIPVLDGGQIALILFEGVIRRDLSLNVKERIMQVGFVLLVGLMAVVLTMDISKSLPESWLQYWPF